MSELIEFLRLRLALVAVLAVTVALVTLGVIDLAVTAAIDALPVYVHVTLGACVFAVSYFVLEYRGMPEEDAAKFGGVLGVASVPFLLLLTEGMARTANGVLELGVPTLFYVAAVSLVVSTLTVAWLERNYLSVRRTGTTRSPVRRN